MAIYNDNTAKAKAQRDAESSAKQTRRDLAVKRVELALAEVPSAFEYRNALIAQDARDGLSIRAIAPLYGMHWTNVARILKGRNTT